MKNKQLVFTKFIFQFHLSGVTPYEDEDDAVRIANNSIYGLSGSVFSAHDERAQNVARRIRTGTMSINGGVAFGAALAGGAIAGPMGAFMALPFAALITSIISNSGKSYAIVYESQYGEMSPDAPDNNAATESTANGELEN